MLPVSEYNKFKGPEDLLACAHGTKFTPLLLKVKEWSWGGMQSYTPCLRVAHTQLFGRKRVYLQRSRKKTKPDFLLSVSYSLISPIETVIIILSDEFIWFALKYLCLEYHCPVVFGQQ